MTVDLSRLRQEFAAIYGREPRLFRAPGRVNLIGEHTDYNGGFVLPMAIEQATFVAAAARDDRKIRVRSVNLNKEAEIDLDAPAQKMRGSWIDFVEGVARILETKNINGAPQPEKQIKLRGADLLLSSDVPNGAGLSSSAALEISVGLALAEISGAAIDKKRLALAGQAAEHEFVGAKVGIMDQFISAMGRARHALLIDCRSLQAEQIPFEIDANGNNGGIVVAICNSNVKHELASSAYNERRAECEQGVEILKKILPQIVQLRDVDVADFERYESNLPEVVRRRCRHVVTENARTIAAAAALRKNDLNEFGRLMRLSHASLRDDYEVSCGELDALVEIADQYASVLGARMTGGGFGGSTVNLVKRKNLDEFVRKISEQYKQRTGKETNVYISQAADGASEITNL